MSRVSPIVYEELSPEQKAVYDEILAAEGSVGGPYAVWLKRPDLCICLHRIMTYMIRESGIEPGLLHTIALVVARKINCRYLFGQEAELAMKAGVSRDTVDAVNQNRRVVYQSEADQALYDASVILAEQRLIPDELYRKCMDLVGRDPTTAASTLIGQYVMAAMILNAYDCPAEEGMIALA